jgi:hypothetical protein
MANISMDTKMILDNATGPVIFRVAVAPARLAVSGPGTLKAWQGNAFDAGVAFTESQTIAAPGRYELTLDSAGYATVQDNGKPINV